ncbi:MAG: bifunctional DNA-formamidopyrimidine glycosylase/DNA-(apurinic or apyrimidinic site) lyase [Phycisphaeraceae bacterium]|nr:MAG: bifunctional DNA-formamidopyrimidine glycosylase/DNA-(apurinic or apyrimidinic site) lyase [Phycisphaeraceae bacterium]
MPELPEAETLRRSLEPALLGRTVERVTVRRRDVIVAPGDPAGGFSRQRADTKPVRFPRELLLAHGRIESLTRHGKQLAITDHRGHAVIVHLGMTGSVTCAASPKHPPHTHVTWQLDDGSTLRFADARRFGLLRLAPDGPAEHWARLGPDALTIRAAALHGQLTDTLRPIKAAMLDQHVLAGVGNIYADEALHAAAIHPARIAASLHCDEARALARAVRRVLSAAISQGGSTIRDYRDGSGRPGSFQSRHRVYGRAGLPCLACGSALERCLLAQRTTVFCPNCQPSPRTAAPA